MKKLTVFIATLFALAAPVASFAAIDHGSRGEGNTAVMVTDPVAPLGVIGNVELSEISAQVRVRMERVLAPL